MSKSIGKSSQSRTAPAGDPDLNPLAFLIDVVGLVGVVQYVRFYDQWTSTITLSNGTPNSALIAL